MGGISFIPTAAQIGAVPNSRLVTAGTNMSGGGALSADIVLNASGGGGGLADLPMDYNGSLVVNATALNITGAGVTLTDAGGGLAHLDIPGGGGGGMTLLSSFTATGGETSVTFNTISQAYNNLRVMLLGKITNTTNAITLRYNNDSGNNYNWNYRNSGQTGGSSTNNDSGFYAGVMADSSVATVSGALEIDIPFYSETHFYKKFFGRSCGIGGLFWSMNDGYWANANAITRLDLLTGPLTANTKVALYGY